MDVEKETKRESSGSEGSERKEKEGRKVKPSKV